MRLRAALAAATVATVATVVAPSGAYARDLAIPPCTLAEAVDIIARGTGASIGTTNPALLRRRIASRRVSGGVADMLRQILGDGVMLRQMGGDAWLIVGLRAPQPAMFAVHSTARVSVVSGPEGHDAAIFVAGIRHPPAQLTSPVNSRTLPGAMIDTASAMRGGDVLADRVALVSGTHLGPGRDKQFVRGIADSSFAGTRAATLAPYLGEQRVTYRSADPGLLPLDLERVEVLAGPHGMLSGAGSLGGSIRLQPQPPRLGAASVQGWGGLAATAHGSTGGDVGAVVDVPVVQDRFGVRALAYHANAGGYIDDVARGAKGVNRVMTTGGRAMARYRDGNWTADLTGAFQSIRSRDAQYAQPNAAGVSGALQRRVGVAEPSSDRIALISATVRREDTPVHLVATAGAVEQRIEQAYAVPVAGTGGVMFHQEDRASLLTLDMRASHDPGLGPGSTLGWLAGASILSSLSRQVRRVVPEGADDRLHLRNDNTELSAFGQVTLRAGRWLSLISGLRLSRVSLNGDAVGNLDSIYFSRERDPIVVARTETRVLPSLAATADMGGTGQAFVRYEQGYRPGGIARGITSHEFASDRIGTIELGLRAARTGPVEWDATLAWSRWSNVQGDLLSQAGLTYTETIGDARVLSADLAMRAQVTGRLQVLGSAILVRDRLHPAAELRSSSHSLPNVPAVSLRGEARYRLPLGGQHSLGLGALVRYDGVSHLGAGANLDVRQGPVTRVDLTGRLDLGALALVLTAENALDSINNRFSFGNPFTLRAGPQTNPQRPRTIRVGFETGF